MDNKKEYTTQEAIDFLIDNDLDEMAEVGDIPSTYLADILRRGFIGYEKYTPEELELELRDRLDDMTIIVKA